MKNAISEFVFQSKYSKYDPSKNRKETWEESVDRVNNMHITHLIENYSFAIDNAEFNNDYLEAINSYKNKLFIGSQRALQFGGDPILKKHCRLFNCSATYIDRLEVFKEIEWVLLCGCGVGVSVEKQHINKLPLMIDNLSKEISNVQIEDSIEGWALAINTLINYYFVENTPYPKFDYSLIRPNGSYITGGFIAPGPEGLKSTLRKIDDLLNKIYSTTKKLSSLNCADIIGYLADSVLSGGIRRAAVIILFDPTDEEMFNCKTGTWFYDNPQRGRFNISGVLDRNEVDRDIYNKLFEATKKFGEPGFFWRSNKGLICNPCGEIGFVPKLNGKTGWQFCNLVTINGSLINTKEIFYKVCKDAATLATVQASYMKFPFLEKITEELVKNDPLIGVSIGGIMCNSNILTDSNILKQGAEIVKQQNHKIASILGIKDSSRCTTIKPDGNSSILLSMTPGCHGEHARNYIRRVQVNKDEEAGQIYKKYNPKAVTESVWSNNNTDWCIAFPISVNNNVILKSELLGIKQLNIISTLYDNWIIKGMKEENSTICNNVSNTTIVPSTDWELVKDYVWYNRNYLGGVSFIAQSGD